MNDRAISPALRRGLALGTGTLLAAAALIGTGPARVADASSTFSISGSMEGNLPVKPGDTLKAGFDVTMPGSHPAATVTVTNAQVSLVVNCPDGSTEPLVIVLPAQQLTIPANNSNWFPSGDQQSPLVYQGSITVPAGSCSGQTGHAPQGATFTALVSSTDTHDALHLRFHYADNTAGSWSGTASIPPPPSSVQIWMQKIDSCRQPVAGATMAIQDASGNTVGTAVSASGNDGAVQSGGSCPIQRGNCNATPTGCLSFTVALPASGSATYTIVETQAPSGYVGCNGGSACGPEFSTVTVNSSGTVTANTQNTFPDGSTVTYPSGGTYAATQSDPILFYDYKLGKLPCDGDDDADDQNSGSVSSHCDNDGDR